MIIDKKAKILPVGFEEITKFLERCGIESKLVNFDKWKFSRTIEFQVYDQVYHIIWYKNMSTLKIGTHNRAPRIPFKYMYHDTTFPLVNGNRSIGFSYTTLDGSGPNNRLYPYEVFRIPLDI